MRATAREALDLRRQTRVAPRGARGVRFERHATTGVEQALEEAAPRLHEPRGGGEVADDVDADVGRVHRESRCSQVRAASAGSRGRARTRRASAAPRRRASSSTRAWSSSICAVAASSRPVAVRTSTSSAPTWDRMLPDLVADLLGDRRAHRFDGVRQLADGFDHRMVVERLMAPEGPHEATHAALDQPKPRAAWDGQPQIGVRRCHLDVLGSGSARGVRVHEPTTILSTPASPSMSGRPGAAASPNVCSSA